MTPSTGKAQPPGGGALGWIGIDESGKGDYFGPLVIAAVHVTPRVAEDLEALNVRDSKKISDGMIKKLAGDIRVLCKHSIVAIGPERYNELYKKIRNLNRLLAWGHAKVLENLLEQVPNCERAIADQGAQLRACHCRPVRRRTADPQCAARKGTEDPPRAATQGRRRHRRRRRLHRRA